MFASNHLRFDTHPTVLVVEDESATRHVLSLLLKRSGYRTLPFPTAEDALRNVASGVRADFALVDFDLPGMNGLDLIRHLRDLDAGICSVLLTAADVNRVTQMLAGGTVPYMQKPINFDELLGHLRDHSLDSLAI